MGKTTRSKGHPLLGARTLLVAPGISTRSILTTSNKKLLFVETDGGLTCLFWLDLSSRPLSERSASPLSVNG